MAECIIITRINGTFFIPEYYKLYSIKFLIIFPAVSCVLLYGVGGEIAFNYSRASLFLYLWSVVVA